MTARGSILAGLESEAVRLDYPPARLLPVGVRSYDDIGVTMTPPVVVSLLPAVCFRPVMSWQTLLLQVTMVCLVLVRIPLMPVLGVPVIIPLVLLMIVIIRSYHQCGDKQTGAHQTCT